MSYIHYTKDTKATKAMATKTVQPCYTLTKSEKAYVREVVERVVIPYRLADLDAFIQSCLHASELLPERLIEWKSETEQFQVGLLRNLPMEDFLMDTPKYRFLADHIPMFSDRVIGVIAALFGHIRHAGQQTHDRHIQNVYPVLDEASTRLPYHADVSDWDVVAGSRSGCAGWVGLLCLCGDRRVVTKIARYEDIQWHQEQLSHLIGAIYSQDVGSLYHEEQTVSTKVAMMGGGWREPATIFDTENVDLESAEADFFSPIVASAKQVSIRMVLEKGDLLMFDNRKTLHGQLAVPPKMDGTDRWIKRVLVASC